MATNNYAYLGMVERGRFRPLATERDIAPSYRLTTTAVNAQEPPESEELSLTIYEGCAVLVRGFDRGEWIHSAIVIDQAGLILTAVVQQVFAAGDKPGQFRLKFPLAA